MRAYVGVLAAQSASRAAFFALFLDRSERGVPSALLAWGKHAVRALETVS